VEGLRAAGFRCHSPEGAYYVMADFSPLAFEGDDVAFARFLTEKVGVAPVPGSSFYRHGEFGRTSVRFTFSKSRATLEEAVGRLRRAFA
jgi:aminotransferase